MTVTIHRYWKQDVTGRPFDEALVWVECDNGQALTGESGQWCNQTADAPAVADFLTAIAPGGDYYNAALAADVAGFFTDETDYLDAVAIYDADQEAQVAANIAAGEAVNDADYAARVDAAGALVTVGLTTAQAALIAGVDPADLGP